MLHSQSTKERNSDSNHSTQHWPTAFHMSQARSSTSCDQAKSYKYEICFPPRFQVKHASIFESIDVHTLTWQVKDRKQRNGILALNATVPSEMHKLINLYPLGNCLNIILEYSELRHDIQLFLVISDGLESQSIKGNNH
eukprot:3640330-Pleurochrysis_carterae.AAC.1